MEAPPPASTTGDPHPPTQRFRIMCSYGGHIIPRPHDKILSYIGGDTRIVLIDRHVSITDLHARLAKTLNQKEPFLLKYQLPSEDLDSLISVATDEDLTNMIEEHDRLRNAPGRLRLFLFPTAVRSFDLGLVCGNKGFSDEWFMGVLNGKVKSLSAAFSDSLNCLIGLELDDGQDDNGGDYASKEGLLEGPLVENEKKLVSENAHSVPQSPIIQANPSPFASSSSSKSVKVGVLGVDEQFQQVGALGNSNHNNVVDQQEQNSKDGVTALVGGGGGGESLNKVTILDHERSDDNGGQVVEKVQTQQLLQRQDSLGGLFELTSPDSISSKGSITNPMSRRQAIRQEPTYVQIQSVKSKTDSNVMDQSNPKILTQSQIHESVYALLGQYDQRHQATLHHPQQFVRPGTQYVPGGPIPVASYYPIYPSQHQNHPNQPTQPHPVYHILARPSQGYGLPQNYGELAPNASSNQSQKAPNMAYSQPLNALLSNPNMASTAPPLVQVPSSQQQPNYAQIHRPAQSMANSKAAYTYGLADAGRAQVLYYATSTQPLAPPPRVAQYQTMMVPPHDGSSQNLTENVNQPQARTVQP